jgi:hypothetical protein
MPAPTQWTCDRCGEAINDVAKGYVVWDRRDDGPEGFRIIHQGRCDDKAYRSSMPLDEFLGVDGLNYLLSFLSLGPLRSGAGERPVVRDIDAFVDFVRRVQLPGYEAVRHLYRDPAVQRDYSDANEHYPYSQEAIAALQGHPRGTPGPDHDGI